MNIFFDQTISLRALIRVLLDVAHRNCHIIIEIMPRFSFL